jgi:glycosyltransferase 2 family protein
MKKVYAKIGALALGLIILGLLVIYADPKTFLSLAAKSDYRLLVLLLVLSNINIIIRIAKWKALLPGVSWRQLAPVQIIGMTLSNFSPGKLAEPVKTVLLKVQTGIPVSSSLPSVIAERVVDIIVLIIFSIFAIVFFLPLGGTLLLVSVISTIAFLVIITLAFLVLLNNWVRNKMFSLAKKLPITKNLSKDFIKTFNKTPVKKSGLLYSLLITAGAWALEGVSIYIAFLALGVSLSPVVLTCIFALAIIIGVITALPGGIGSTDVVMVLFLGMLSVGKAEAVTGFLLYRFLSFWYLNALGGVFSIYIFKKVKLTFH